MPSPTHARGLIRFGDFEVDVDSQELRHAGVPCRLQPQPLKVLVLLVTAKGRIVTREQLQQELWGEETFVDFEQGLNYCIRQIRTVLGDEPQNPRYVETIPRRGYRFVAEVRGLEEAHAVLGTVYLNVEQLQLAEEHEKKAVALSDRVSEREKLYITAHYYALVGQHDKVIQTYETYSRLYPHDTIPELNLANEYDIRGRFDKALEHALKGVGLDQGNAGAHGEAAVAYMGLGQLEEAKSTLVEGLKISPDNSELHMLLSNVAVFRGDAAMRDREDGILKATPSGNLELLYRDAALAAARGRLRQSEDLYSQAVQLALKLNLKENASFAMGLRAVYEAYLQERSQARTSANAALKLSPMSDTIEPVAVALAASGDIKRAETLIDNLAKRRPDDTTIQFQYAPMIHAMSLIHHNDLEGAIRIMAPGVPYDRGGVDSMLVRGEVFLQAKRSAEATEEFRRIVGLRARYPYDPGCALAELGLARAYAQAGDKPSSLAAYQDFLTLWKDADRDLPALKQAEAEYAALRN